MAWVPDACTLPTEQVPLRVAAFNDLFARTLRHLTRPEPTWLRLGLEDTPQAAATVSDLIARETACCSFFNFATSHSDSRLWLDVRVPAGREPVLDSLARQATTHAPEGVEA